MQPLQSAQPAPALPQPLQSALPQPQTPELDLPGPGVHLALGRAAGEVVVSWSTVPAPASTGAWLRYARCAPPCRGAAPPALDGRIAAETAELSNNEAKAGPSATTAWRNISVHHARITDLQPQETLFYAVSGDARVLNFTYSAPHGRAGPVTFAIFGDLAVKEQEGANYTLNRLKEHRRRGDFQAVLHVGDIAYDLRQNAGRTGDEFLADMEPVASSVPYMTVAGNHERDCVAAGGAKPEGSCADPPYTNYRTRFEMPTPPGPAGQDPGHAPMYWSADIGSVHVIGLNTDTCAPPPVGRPVRSVPALTPALSALSGQTSCRA